MQYYKNYLEEDHLNFGKLEFMDNTFYVNDNEVLNNRALVNDIVYVKNNEVVEIKEREIKNIIGILYLDSKIKYGNINNKSLYLFKPTHKSYPNFYIPYNNNKINKIYVIIKFKEWKISDKLPIGNLIDVLGDVGEKEAEFEHLRHFFEINNKIWKIDHKIKNEHLKILNDLESVNEDYQIFSIDPLGSKDIDDAFHFNIKGHESYEIGIHIASPTKFLENNLGDILNRVSTVYSSIKNYNLIPNLYAEELVSLLEGCKRYSLSLILTICYNEIINYELKETIVKNIKNYHYDEFDKVYHKDTNLCNFVNFTKKFFKLEFIDSHKLVENWMILANKKVAEYLIGKNLKNVILRVHNNSDILINDLNVEKELKEYINIRNEKSALYKIYEIDELNQKHSKLGNNYYTHFTSPIRRAVDFFIHMLIIKNQDILDKNELQSIIDKINIFTKNSRKYDRNVKRLDFLYSISSLNKNIITYGYIVKITKNKLSLYIPLYNLEEKVVIIPYKFEKIVEIKCDTYEDNAINKIIYVIDNVKKEYYLYQKLEIKLWVFTSFENIFDKLKVEIL